MKEYVFTGRWFYSIYANSKKEAFEEWLETPPNFFSIILEDYKRLKEEEKKVSNEPLSD